MNRLNDQIQEELEIRINDAADGLLSESALQKLEQDLQKHPDLLEQYQKIMGIPDLSGVYGELNSYRNEPRVHQILNEIRRVEQSTSFENITMLFFKKYALAASILMLAITSIFYITMPEMSENGEISFEELLYPAEEPAGEDYITYLNEWMEP